LVSALLSVIDPDRLHGWKIPLEGIGIADRFNGGRVIDINRPASRGSSLFSEVVYYFFPVIIYVDQYRRDTYQQQYA
jgi:hypothetical protein